MAHEKLRPQYFFDEEKIKQLKQIAPECFEDGKINFETLRQNLGDWIQDEDDQELEHFGLFWPGKKEARKIAAIPPQGTLVPVYGEGLKADGVPDTDGENDSKNIFIEGENLEVLKILQKSYAGKIKVIYIDPPYNTGKDFVYEDNFKEPLNEYLKRTGQIDEEGKPLTTNKKADGRFHSKWLSMMYPRLRLSYNLLRNDGILFISIDDNEVNNLKSLCCEIYGEENFLAQIIWKSGRTSSGHFTNENEYILAFSKNKDQLSYFSYEGNELISDRAVKRPSIKNPVSKIKFPKGIDFECSNKVFPTQFGDAEPIKVVDGTFEAYDSKLKNDVVLEAAWTMKDQIESWLSGSEVYDQKGQKVKRFYFKSNGVLQYEKEKGTIHPKTTINGISTKQGSKEIEKYFGSSVFDFPKPTNLIKELINPVVKDDDIILDFFAGSGSTAEAILSLSNSLNKNLSFIVVQWPEKLSDDNDGGKNAIKLGFEKLSEVTLERIKKSIEVNKYIGGVKTFVLSESNYKIWDKYDGIDLQSLENQLSLYNEDPLKDTWSSSKLLYEVILLEGFILTCNIQREILKDFEIINVKDNDSIHSLKICLEKNINPIIIEELNLLKDQIFICFDSAISNVDKLRLSDKGLIKTI
jgi:adenine-specific DNA-methyltransferase